MAVSIRRVGLGLASLIAAAFVVGALGNLALGLLGLSATSIEWALLLGLTAVVSALLLPFAAWFAAKPFVDLCFNHDHISEITLPWLATGPGLVFGLVCVAAYLLLRTRLPFPAIVGSSAVASVPIFVAAFLGAHAWLSQMRADCPMQGG